MFHLNFLVLVFFLFISSGNVWAQECVDFRGKYTCKFQMEGLIYQQAVLYNNMGSHHSLKKFDEYSYDIEISQSLDEGVCTF